MSLDGTIRVVDETPAGVILGELTLALSGERITIRALIERRVRADLAALDTAPPLVEPTATEAELNGPRRERRLDADAQCARAFEAFSRGGLLIVVDDRQVEGLDEELVISSATLVSFIKLVPLVGG